MPRVRITPTSVKRGLAATPDTPLWIARDRWMYTTDLAAKAAAPVNNPLNALHRGGVVGTYAASFHARRTTSPTSIGFVYGNRANHASVVEWGRSASNRRQRFSWTRYPGVIASYSRTRARDGDHVIADAVTYALAHDGLYFNLY
jgi:hypothetical protein